MLIVLKESNRDPIERIIAFRRWFLDWNISVDVIVYTEKELEEMEKEHLLGSLLEQEVVLA
ncbi:MAG: hypothetical protein DRN65_07055 [Thaumarchaeota archaeon]|nr:MAG: hypothetical protein DRN65_07055 [Nitrososphaerota archaeon]